MAHNTTPKTPDPTIFSPSHYGEDDPPIHSDEGNESEDESFGQARTSTEVREHDRRVFFEEDEREEMLRQNSRTNNRGGLTSPLKSLIGKAYSTIPTNNEPPRDLGGASK